MKSKTINPYLNLKPKRPDLDKQIKLGIKMARIFRVQSEPGETDLPLLSAYWGSYNEEVRRLRFPLFKNDTIGTAEIPVEFIEADKKKG